jgi:hypothetical protein
MRGWRRLKDTPHPSRFEPFLCLLGFSVGRMVEHDEARLSFMRNQQTLSVFGKQHEVGLPVPRRRAIGGFGRPFADRTTMLDVAGCAAAAFSGAPAPVARQQARPMIALPRAMIGEPVDLGVAGGYKPGQRFLRRHFRNPSSKSRSPNTKPV